MIRPPLVLLVVTIGLFIKLMGCLEKHNLVPTLLLIFWTFLSHREIPFVD
jgi:hypothetical protein